jgi:hypothetical protein
MHWRDLTSPEYIAESEAQMADFERTRRIGPYHKEYFLADGSKRWMMFWGHDAGERRDGHAVLIIEDNCKGYEAEALRGSYGMGLINMRERGADRRHRRNRIANRPRNDDICQGASQRRKTLTPAGLVGHFTVRAFYGNCTSHGSLTSNP